MCCEDGNPPAITATRLLGSCGFPPNNLKEEHGLECRSCNGLAGGFAALGKSNGDCGRVRLFLNHEGKVQMELGLITEVCELKDRPSAISIEVAMVPWDKTRASIRKAEILIERDEQSLKIEVGDYVWWDRAKAYWTPAKNMRANMIEFAQSGMKSRVHFDIPIPRVICNQVQSP